MSENNAGGEAAIRTKVELAVFVQADGEENDGGTDCPPRADDLHWPPRTCKESEAKMSASAFM